jgi:hypothetical protein
MPLGDQTPAVMNRDNAGTFIVDQLVVNGPITNPGVGTEAGPWIFNVVTYGAKGDGRITVDGAMTSGSTTLTCATSTPFTAADIGKAIMVKGAGASGITTLVTTITAISDPGHITLAAAASTTVTGATVMWATDDTPAFTTAINAAAAYAQANGAAKVFIPPAARSFYGIAGPLITGGATKGNAQIPLPIITTTGNKTILTIEGATNGSGLQHWQQTVPQLSGSTLVSFGVFASASAQTTSINAAGNACVIGGPAQPGGYGVAPGVYSNMLITLRNLSILTTHSANGLTYSAADFSGVAEANLFDFAYGTTGNVPANDFATPNTFAIGLSIGLLMPANGNNDNCLISNLSIHGGYTYGLFATEHTVIDAARILYCWSAFCPVGFYNNSVGATHAIYAAQLSIEGCTNLIYVIGAGSSGIGPIVDVAQLDTETAAPTFGGNSAAAMAAALGTVKLTGLFTASAVTASNPTGLRVVNGQVSRPAAAKTAAYTVTILDETVLVDATAGPVTVTLIDARYTPNAYTVIKTDATANAVTVTAVNAQTINGAATKVLSTQYATTTVYSALVASAWNWYTR